MIVAQFGTYLEFLLATFARDYTKEFRIYNGDITDLNCFYLYTVARRLEFTMKESMC